MPLYEYRCTNCGERTEVLQHLGEAPLRECPRCGGTLEKLISAPALQFKGTGWYVTDYGHRHSTAATTEPSKEAGGPTSPTKEAGAAAKPAAATAATDKAGS